MAFNQATSPEKLEHLLDWLDPNRERASSRYLCVHTALVKIFESRGCDDADQLADLTIDRVMEKAEHVAKLTRATRRFTFTELQEMSCTSDFGGRKAYLWN